MLVVSSSHRKQSKIVLLTIPAPKVCPGHQSFSSLKGHASVRHFSRLINYEPEGDDESIDLEEDFGSNSLTRTSSGIRRLLHGERINELEEEGNTDDPLYRISYATALEDVFEVLREVGPENVTAEQASQAVVTIRDLQVWSMIIFSSLFLVILVRETPN